MNLKASYPSRLILVSSCLCTIFFNWTSASDNCFSFGGSSRLSFKKGTFAWGPILITSCFLNLFLCMLQRWNVFHELGNNWFHNNKNASAIIRGNLYQNHFGGNIHSISHLYFFPVSNLSSSVPLSKLYFWFPSYFRKLLYQMLSISITSPAQKLRQSKSICYGHTRNSNVGMENMKFKCAFC